MSSSGPALASSGASTNGPGPDPPTGVDRDAPLVVHNLLSDLATLMRLLVGEARRGSWLDAYLLAAGAGQIAEDYVHPEVHPLDAATEYLTGQASPVVRVSARAAAAVAGAGRAARGRWSVASGVIRWQRDLAELLDALADAVVGRVPSATRYGGVQESCTALAAEVEKLPARLRQDVVRLPSCFHAFDQQPADLARLAGEFADRWPDRRRPLLVVGVRTSGSYLAPLLAAFLRAGGFEDVRVLTVRPGRGLLRHERELVRRVARSGGLALVTDDPPGTGGSIAGTARQLEQAGIPHDDIVLLFQVVGDSTDLPSTLRSHEAVVLPSSQWAVTAKLNPSAVKEALATLLGPSASVLAVERLPLPARRPARGHLRALYRVDFHGADPADRAQQRILVEGVGLGYFGRFTLAAARALEQFSPRVYGLEEGLLYREWLPDEQRIGSLDSLDEHAVAGSIAAYAAERHRTLPASEDVSLRMTGQDAAWEIASTTMSRVFGRAWPLARVLLTDRAAKRLLRVERASIVDGNTDLGQWFFRDGSRRSLVKVNVGEHLFSNLGLSCFDPAFDLAGVTARAGTPSFTSGLRRAYAQLVGRPIDEERWLLYELAHLWRRERTQPETEAELRRARSRALQRYFADVYLHDVASPASGPLCALDVDGVLETEHLGFPALSPASALALRALMLHGYRPVLATGRSLRDVIERCSAYRLAGGVAEYGAAAYDSRDGNVSELLPEGAAEALERLRTALAEVVGVEVEPDYRLGVRAFRSEHGRRLALRPETISAALAHTGSEVIRPIQGDGQTDFMVRGVDKGIGMRALSARLGVPEGRARPFDLAVGDTAADIPLAALALRACAPAHARTALRKEGFSVMRRPYQSGLAQAVGQLLGHPPGGCEVCRVPDPAPERRTLLALLAAQERGRLGIMLQAFRLGFQIA